MDRIDVYTRCSVHLTRTRHPRYSWRLYYNDPETTTRKDKNFRTKGDAEDWAETELLKLIRKAEQGRKAEFTFKDALSFYRDQASIGINGRPPVGAAYLKNLERYERLQLSDCPFLNDPIDSTPEDECVHFMRRLRERQTEVAANAGKYLKSAVALAKQEFQCSTDPIRDVRTPPKRSSRKRETNKTIMTRRQVRALMDHFRKKREKSDRATFRKAYHKIEVACAIAAMTGMRIGEIAALRREDVDLETRVIQVERAVKGDGSIGPPKSDAGARSIPFDKALEKSLSEYFDLWDVKSGLILASEQGNPLNRHNTQRAIRSAVDELELPRTGLHGLRHYYVSCLIAGGVDAKTIIYRVGHTDYAFTMRQYGHLMADPSKKPYVVAV